MAPRGLNLRDGTHDGRETLVLAGELDLATAPELEAKLAELCAGHSTVILDLRPLVFIDSTGLRALLAARDLCAESRCEFYLIPGPPGVQRLFELTGVLHLMPFVDPSP